LIELRLLFLYPDIEQPCLQHAHRRVLVPVLRPLVLARDDDARRQVGNADGRVGHVDVLASGAARSEGVDADVLVVDDDILIFRQFRPHVDRRERRVAPRSRIERRNPYEPVHPSLG
jgi:hypothetical protein